MPEGKQRLEFLVPSSRPVLSVFVELDLVYTPSAFRWCRVSQVRRAFRIQKKRGFADEARDTAEGSQVVKPRSVTIQMA